MRLKLSSAPLTLRKEIHEKNIPFPLPAKQFVPPFESPLSTSVLNIDWFHYMLNVYMQPVYEKAKLPTWCYARTLLDRCLKVYTTLWNIWTYQQLCKKITQLVYNFTQIVYNFTQVVYFFYTTVGRFICFTQVVYFFYTTVGRFICFTVLCKLFKQWSNSVFCHQFNIVILVIK